MGFYKTGLELGKGHPKVAEITTLVITGGGMMNGTTFSDIKKLLGERAAWER